MFPALKAARSAARVAGSSATPRSTPAAADSRLASALQALAERLELVEGGERPPGERLHQPGLQGDARHLAIGGSQGPAVHPAIVELHEGQAGHAQRAERGGGAAGQGQIGGHRDAHQQRAQVLGVDRDGAHAPHRHAAVAHARLCAQAVDVAACLEHDLAHRHALARKPPDREHDAGTEQDCEQPGGKRVGTVFHFSLLLRRAAGRSAPAAH